jgi:hypothetical protein
MIASNIILTETYLDLATLQRLIGVNFIQNNTLDPKHLANLEPTETDEMNYQHYLSTSQILSPDLQGKEDLPQYLASLYETRSTPTLLFLGDLSSYSEQMQEGMLRILEEPPTNLYILLFAQNASQIIPTISSRSQIYQLPHQLIRTYLDPDLLTKVKTKLPPPADTFKDLLHNQFTLPDLNKVEREEIDFWLWQLQSYCEAGYNQQPNPKIEKVLSNILQAREYNLSNVQKKLSLTVLI